jgi:hypothetical protein
VKEEPEGIDLPGPLLLLFSLRHHPLYNPQPVHATLLKTLADPTQQRTIYATSPTPWTSPLPAMGGVFGQNATIHLPCRRLAVNLTPTPETNSPG